MFARTNLKTSAVEATVYVLPETMQPYSHEQLRDLGFAGMPGYGLLPIVPRDKPSFDPDLQRLGDLQVDAKADLAAGVAHASYPVLQLTREERRQRDPFPNVVTDWQFAGQAAELGIITQDEALAWSGSGVVPAVLEAAVKQAITDPDRQFKVLLFLTGSKEYPRDHQLTPMLAPLLGMADGDGNADEDALDEFWRAASKR